MPRPTTMVTAMVASSPTSPMPAVTATLAHADRLIAWSAASWELARLTPPAKYSSSRDPASPVHWSGVIGSSATGAPADTAPSIWDSCVCSALFTCALNCAWPTGSSRDSASTRSPCRVAAISAMAARSAWVILFPASTPDSSAYSSDRASRADTVAISPRAWAAAVALVRLSASARNSLSSFWMPALYPPSACSGLTARLVTAARSVCIWFSPAMRTLMAFASAGVWLPLVPGEFIAARNVGLSASVALTAASYAARLAGVGWNR